ncbi:MAG: GxxExxY protein [Chloroflexi bacterium]|nr:MAG: GxxExxY protein [Chloroflexota bacterium]
MNLVEDATGNKLTFAIIGVAMGVHNRLVPGYPEEVYERALFAELDQRGFVVRRQAPVEVFSGDDRVGLFFLDLFVDETVVVEVKAFSHLLTNDEIAQVINYLIATGAPVGLLINFGRKKLDFRRIFPPKDAVSRVRRAGRYNVRKSFLPDPGMTLDGPATGEPATNEENE